MLVADRSRFARSLSGDEWLALRLALHETLASAATYENDPPGIPPSLAPLAATYRYRADVDEAASAAATRLSLDGALTAALTRLVPIHVPETIFWRNVLLHIAALVARSLEQSLYP